jgi:hypothetical protein
MVKDKRKQYSYKEIVNVMNSIERDVIAGSRVSQHELQLIVTTHKFSKVETDIFTALIQQSEIILLEEEDGVTYLVRNPAYLVEEELTQPRTITDKLK